MIKITGGYKPMLKHEQHIVGVGTHIACITGRSNKAYELR